MPDLLAPNLQGATPHYEPGYFSELFELEEGSFWFQNRNRLIEWALERCFPAALSFLEIGCGTGFVLAALEKKFPHLRCAGGEIYADGLLYASRRLQRSQLMQIDVHALPFEKEFDVIGAFDVLEHIDQDEWVLSQMHRALSPSGGILLTVPHHPFLWSDFDEFSRHARRYRARQVKDKLKKSGFEIVLMTSFVSLLLPLMLLSRIRRKGKGNVANGMKHLRPPKTLNEFLGAICKLERHLIRKGIRFPFGGSLLVAAKKKTV